MSAIMAAYASSSAGESRLRDSTDRCGSWSEGRAKKARARGSLQGGVGGLVEEGEEAVGGAYSLGEARGEGVRDVREGS